MAFFEKEGTLVNGELSAKGDFYRKRRYRTLRVKTCLPLVTGNAATTRITFDDTNYVSTPRNVE